ncbi:soluble guanylate cyclase 89Db-like [Ornithodoros turicata]|uniref:soluble guanylate cyclase 89Db-like n=1 Tax=Ornithodoros turicata TaxID=34597 RepID=UPI003138B55A
MYGMLLESVQYYVRKEFGEQLWATTLEEVGYKNAAFSTHHIYPDHLMARLACACARHTPGWSSDDFLCFFGKCFVRFFSYYGYDILIRSSGRFFRDFLIGIDNLHHQIRFSYPRMHSPSMYVETEDRGGLVLHYRSKRSGYHYYVVGQLEQIAKTFYGMDVQVQVLRTTLASDGQGSHTVYRLQFDNSAFEECQAKRRDIQSRITLPDLGWDSFFVLFPFGLVLDRKMNMVKVGERLKMICGDGPMVCQPVHDFFKLHRPCVPFVWDKVMTMQQVVVELECLKVKRPSRGGNETGMLLKGQMRYLEESDVLLFLGVPLLSGIDEMQDAGLYLEDLCIHDMTRDIVLAGWQHGANLEVSYQAQEQKSRTLEENLRRLDEWRKKGDDLLYSMLPKTVADRLRKGAHPVDTCETFDCVTVMFSELVNFATLCLYMSPMEVVKWVNDAFSLFDRVTDQYNVFKVETVGQVYMLVSGAPERRKDHAEQASAAALEMLSRFREVNEAFQGQETFLKIGIHSGPVAAGVVGLKMLRYCLFGDTVNTAARMQTHGQSGKIHISEGCQRLIRDKGFVTEVRGKIEVKGKGKMTTYWLLQGDVPYGAGRRRVSVGDVRKSASFRRKLSIITRAEVYATDQC